VFRESQSMKLILSRKGFDSGYGGGDSPIMPDARLVSLPIPSADAICYRDIRSGRGGMTLAELVDQLYGPERLQRIGEHCHLDPDLASWARRRSPNWRGVLGQMGAAQGHLRNQGVAAGDLFLFFGRFRASNRQQGRLRFVAGSMPAHVIFGYLQVADVVPVLPGKSLPRWLHYHPHVQARDSAGANNTLYLAARQLSLDPRLPGWACLNYHPGLRLTKTDSRRLSDWQLPPEIFRSAAISYHSAGSWRGDIFRAAAKGQEFVLDADAALQRWALQLIQVGTKGASGAA
jgi:hypothetical protein